MSSWDEMIPDADRAVYDASGYGRHGPLGSRPALLIVDVTYNFVGDQPEPILESVRRFPLSCGEAGWRAVSAIQRLLTVVRAKRIPIIYTQPEDRKNRVEAGRWLAKQGRSLEQPLLANRIVDEIAPEESDLVIRKPKPSAFFATSLVSYLIQLEVDTLIVCGGTTSGCLRATVNDAFSYNFAVAVAEEGAFDRSDVAHRANLFDIAMKYGEVMAVEQVEDYLRSLHANRAGTFETSLT
jgi:maleamate amidohydrolase